MPPILFLGGALACFGLGSAMLILAARRCRPAAEPAAARSSTLVKLGLMALVLGGLALVRWYIDSSGAATDDNHRAAAYLIKLLKTDKYARLNRLGGGFQRGPKEVQPSSGKSHDDDLSDEQIRDVERIISAVTEADLATLRAIIAGYADRPYASAQIGAALSYVFYLGDVDLTCMSHERWLYIEDSLRDGGLILVLSADNEIPEVHLSLEDREHPRQYSSEVSQLMDAQQALSIFQRELVPRLLERIKDSERRQLVE